MLALEFPSLYCLAFCAAVAIHPLTPQDLYLVRLTIGLHLQTIRQTARCDICASNFIMVLRVPNVRSSPLFFENRA